PEHVRQRTRIVLRVRFDLRPGDVSGSVDELAEVAIGDWRAVDPETIDRDPMRRCLFGVMTVRSHAECAAGDPDHAFRYRWAFNSRNHCSAGIVHDCPAPRSSAVGSEF